VVHLTGGRDAAVEPHAERAEPPAVDRESVQAARRHADERLRFWEIFKGITTPAVSRVLQSQIAGLDAHFRATHDQLQTIQQSAKDLRQASAKDLGE
jgi:hypothetical protein